MAFKNQARHTDCINSKIPGILCGTAEAPYPV